MQGDPEVKNYSFFLKGEWQCLPAMGWSGEGDWCAWGTQATWHSLTSPGPRTPPAVPGGGWTNVMTGPYTVTLSATTWGPKSTWSRKPTSPCNDCHKSLLPSGDISPNPQTPMKPCACRALGFLSTAPRKGFSPLLPSSKHSHFFSSLEENPLEER